MKIKQGRAQTEINVSGTTNKIAIIMFPESHNK
jgi:hypothetical protein